jgi:hypothetical protein
VRISDQTIDDSVRLQEVEAVKGWLVGFLRNAIDSHRVLLAAGLGNRRRETHGVANSEEQHS